MKIEKRRSGKQGPRRIHRRLLALTLAGAALLGMTQPADARPTAPQSTGATRTVVIPLTPVLKCEKHLEGWGPEAGGNGSGLTNIKVLRYDLCLERQGNSIAAGVSINNNPANPVIDPFNPWGTMIARLLLCNNAETVVEWASWQQEQGSSSVQLPIRSWTKYVYGEQRWYRVQMQVSGQVSGINPQQTQFSTAAGHYSKFTSQCIYI